MSLLFTLNRYISDKGYKINNRKNPRKLLQVTTEGAGTRSSKSSLITFNKFSQKVPSPTFDSLLNTPLICYDHFISVCSIRPLLRKWIQYPLHEELWRNWRLHKIIIRCKVKTSARIRIIPKVISFRFTLDLNFCFARILSSNQPIISLTKSTRREVLC